ncbi:MAG: hypothetical protein ACOCXJ_03360, partial [Planctomycetota bacterium]
MRHLSRATQLRGQRRFVAAMYLNPMGAGLTIGPLIALLALHYGAGDLTLALLFAAPHLSGFAAVLGPRLLAGLDTSRIISGVWLWRALVGLGYLLLPLIPTDEHKILLLLATCYGFMFLRAFGVTAFTPVLKALTRPGELTAFAAQTQVCWQVGTLGSTVLSYLVLSQVERWPTTEQAYLSLLAVGFVFNLGTGLLLRRLPPTGTMDGGGFRSVAWALRRVAGDASHRTVIWISIVQVVQMVAAGYQLAYLKNVLQLGDDTVFALTLGSVIAAVLSTRLLGMVGDSISRRALLVGTHTLLLLAGICWLLIDRLQPPVHGMAAGALFIAATALIANAAALQAGLATAQLPERHRMQISLVYQLGTVLGALLGIGLINGAGSLLPNAATDGYVHSFLLLIACSVSLCLLGLRVTGAGAEPLLRDLAQLTPANVIALLRLHRLDQQDDGGMANMR